MQYYTASIHIPKASCGTIRECSKPNTSNGHCSQCHHVICTRPKCLPGSFQVLIYCPYLVLLTIIARHKHNASDDASNIHH